MVDDVSDIINEESYNVKFDDKGVVMEVIEQFKQNVFYPLKDKPDILPSKKRCI